MSDRISKFAPQERKRYGKICVRVEARERAILLEWLKLAGSTASEDLRSYIRSTVATIEEQVSKLPDRERKAFWSNVQAEMFRDFLPGVGKGGRAKEIQRRLRALRKAA